MNFDSKKQYDIASKIFSKEDALEKWRDYKWQLANSIKTVDSFQRLTGIDFSKAQIKEINKTLSKFPLSITPYYVSLINRKDYKDDPIFKQSFPSSSELIVGRHDMKDPLSEEKDSPVSGITHRYPDRVLFEISNTCSMYCRHCTRKRKVGDSEFIPSKKKLLKGINYIKKTPKVRDVLLSGGDPLMLSDDYLDWVLKSIKNISHVEIVRIGTRMPVVLPYRITDSLVKILKKHQPLWLNTHFNHPREITVSARKALGKLADAGIPLGNQSVLLAGVNDCPRIIKSLVHKLVQNRVRPYYMYQCDLAEGLNHFRTPVGKGIEIIENLIGHTTGFAVPTYIVDAPGGGGKIPVMPNYIISWSTNKVILRNYEGSITTYKEPSSYEPIFCNRDCHSCRLHLDLAGAREYGATGIAKLLCDFDDSISFTPGGTERIKRRENNQR